MHLTEERRRALDSLLWRPLAHGPSIRRFNAVPDPKNTSSNVDIRCRVVHEKTSPVRRFEGATSSGAAAPRTSFCPKLLGTYSKIRKIALEERVREEV